MFQTLAGATALMLLASTVAHAEPPPASAFGRAPATVSVRISPNGQTIAILGGGPAERTLSFSTVDKPGLSVLRLGDVETMSVFWATDAYAIARYAIKDRFEAGPTYRFERYVAVTPQAKVASFLLKSDQVSSMSLAHTVLGVVDGPPPRLMMRGLNYAVKAERDANTRIARRGGNGDLRVATLLSVDPATGRGVEVLRGDFDVARWEVDLSGEPRVMIEIDEITTKYRLSARAKTATRWQLIQDGRDETSEFLGYSDPDDAIYFSKVTPQGVQVVRRLLETGAVEPVGGLAPEGGQPWLLWDPYTNGVRGIGLGGYGGKVEWLDPVFSQAEAQLGRAFKGKSVSVSSWSRDRSRMIASVESGDAPKAFYLLDRTRGELSPVGDAYPELAEASLGRTSRFRYKARDGLEIPAYLTLPASLSTGARAPLVVLPHGGPDARDDDQSFDYLVQFLASRGYAVLRPQYRGSAGFGSALKEAGEGEWGGKVQSDLLDGVAAAAAAGSVDASRVCIVGDTIFGGFTALLGAVTNGSAYRCAVSIGGVPDLGLLIGDHRSGFGDTSKSYRLLRAHILKATSGRLEDISPLRRASEAGAPILLIHAEDDLSVPAYHAKRMADALAKAGKPVEHLVLPADGHALAKSASRTLMLETLEAFLARNLAAPRS